MAHFEHMSQGVGLHFRKDLEAVVGGSEKTACLVEVERPLIVQSEKPFEVIEIRNEQVPKGAVAYTAGQPVMVDGVIYMPLMFYRKK
jgi:hypothetical protein